jgi:hypothetical protein
MSARVGAKFHLNVVCVKSLTDNYGCCNYITEAAINFLKNKLSQANSSVKLKAASCITLTPRVDLLYWYKHRLVFPGQYKPFWCNLIF